MITRAQRLREIASELRSMAALAKDVTVLAQLVEVVDHLEDLARSHEPDAATTAAGSQYAPQHGAIEEVSEPADDSLKELYAYWFAKNGSQMSSAGSAIPLEKIAGLLPKIALVDVVGDPPRFRFRRFGTKVAEFFGENLAGKFLEEIDLGHGTLSIDLAHLYTKMVEEGRPQAVRIRLTKRDGRHVEYERIGLPITKDGKTVTMFLFAYAFEREVFPAAQLI